MLPTEVLEEARAELTDWRGSGMSLMEVSHRSKAFLGVAAELQALLRELADIPREYHVLLLQGGASAQFAGVPLNLAAADSTADYLNTGAWSTRAIHEAERFCRVHLAADEAGSRYTTVPAPQALELTPSAAYVHYTPNETIGGVEFPYVPQTGSVPLVADMSSVILSQPLDVRRFALIYAGAQKNIGPAGLTVVIVREDLVGRARSGTPVVLDYGALSRDGSMVNTPPTFAWYLAGLNLKWVKAQGGLATMAERNRAKADTLYRAIDSSDFYRNPVAKQCRSRMNVPFTLPNRELEKQFLAESAAAGLTNLEGHRSVGGMRASLYNAMPLAGVEALVEFMRQFERRNG
jgi:phosphoserine aminotransferase